MHRNRAISSTGRVTRAAKYPQILKRRQIFICDPKGHSIYRYPLWLCVSGKQAHTLSLEAIYRYYRQRFDIEYFFKLGKTRLMMNAFQTPETENEENWMQLVMTASHMRYHAKPLAEQSYRPWERSKVKRLSTTAKTPFQVFRVMPEIISQVGTPADSPKGLSQNNFYIWSGCVNI